LIWDLGILIWDLEIWDLEIWDLGIANWDFGMGFRGLKRLL